MSPLPVAVDAMGGDNAPAAIIEGARIAAAGGLDVVLVGPPEQLNGSGLEVIPASQVVDMDADPGTSVRRLKDSSVVRAAEAVRDRRACAMVSAGNTGAAMATALLRFGRIKGVVRPAVACPFPVPGRAAPTVVLDCGANSDCAAAWLVQFARMGAVYARAGFGVARPRVGLLSIGEEAGKGSALVKETFDLLGGAAWQDRVGASFVGNVEGRDLLVDRADVIVTDGFTGNVMLKTAEGVAAVIAEQIIALADSSPEARAGADLFFPALMGLYETFDPDNTGGAVLLGVRGVCTISHGSSGPKAIANAVGVAHGLAAAGIVEQIAAAVAG
ncbi:MAG: phosphate acyltransferase PlsX [bacterium]|nr:phosphate acyltransferase PlsX [bacterium]MCY3925291.1 phosphate acyltransferase PlsX [bacterium]